MMTAENLMSSKSLNDLFDGLDEDGATIAVTGVAIDSREVKLGDLFMAYPGTQRDGTDYIESAIENGAVAIAIDEQVEFNTKFLGVPLIRIANLRSQAGIIASRFFNHPSHEMQVIGVTGTNGKTTVSYMLVHAMQTIDHQAALVGTLGHGRLHNIQSGNTTTPDVVKLHSLFDRWQDTVDTVVMEVSSHALDQGRVSGVRFDTAIFTNLSRDHLDYHNSIDVYAVAKFQLFYTDDLNHAVINLDDNYGRKLIEQLPAELDVHAYSKQKYQAGDLPNTLKLTYCESVKIKQRVMHLSVISPWGKCQIDTHLLGQFNIENLLAALVTLCVSGIEIQVAASVLSSFDGVPGRMESFQAKSKPLIVVDYAHTPDALEKALIALKLYCKGKLYCVFGCGGDRDMGKRADMGAVASNLADQIIITNDNPRSEEPEKIAEDILSGINDQSKVSVRFDRSDAITYTFLNALAEDVILIAGKGHETTQKLGDVVLPFSDRELARRLMEMET